MLFSTFFLLSILLAVNAVDLKKCHKKGHGHSNSTSNREKTANKYVQHPSGSASFTVYSGCGAGACGKAVSGYTAAMNQLAFGSAPDLGPGDACGRCFSLTGTADPYSPDFTGPFHTIVVKVTNLCPAGGNGNEWCAQTTSNPVNLHGKAFHFDICEDTGAAAAFFPSGRGALTGHFTEVSCSESYEWPESDDGAEAWNGACLAGETAANWPAVGCGNRGTPP